MGQEKTDGAAFAPCRVYRVKRQDLCVRRLRAAAIEPPGPKESAVHPARPHTSVGTVEEYDPATNTWRERAAMPTPRNHATAGVVNGKIYVIGGRVGAAFISAGSSNVDVVEEYDPASDAWGSARARMPSARSCLLST